MDHDIRCCRICSHRNQSLCHTLHSSPAILGYTRERTMCHVFHLFDHSNGFQHIVVHFDHRSRKLFRLPFSVANQAKDFSHGSLLYGDYQRVCCNIEHVSVFESRAESSYAELLHRYYRFTIPGTTIYLFFYIIEASTAMWIGNTICCWQLLSRVFHTRSFENTQRGHVTRNSREGRGHSELRQTRNTTWWSRFIAMFKPRQVEGAVEQDHEMNLRTPSAGSDIRHNATPSRDTIMFAHAELFAYLEGPNIRNSTIHSLARDLDAGPALAYREAHRIE